MAIAYTSCYHFGFLKLQIMKTLQDVLDKTNDLFPWEKVETRSKRDEILRELFYVNQDVKKWSNISIFNQNRDLDVVLAKHFHKLSDNVP